jgi:NAD(P)H-flavin reductase
MTHSLPVAGAQLLGGDMLWLTLDATGTPVAAAYTGAGQYVTLSTRGSPPGFFAMASAPGDSRLSFLIRIERHKPKTAPLAGLVPGDLVDMSDVQGAGYRLAAQAGRDLIFVAGGTGIAPIRAALFEVIPQRARFGAVTVVYGANTRNDLAFASEHERWREAGVRFIPCVRTPEAGWTGATGFVTSILPTLPLDPARMTAIVVGPAAMTAPVIALLHGRGIPAARIIENMPA